VTDVEELEELAREWAADEEVRSGENGTNDSRGVRRPALHHLEADGVTARQVVVPGGGFIFDDGAAVTALWGRDDAPLWAEGESLFVTGPSGLGKSTLAQRVVLAQLGLVAPEVLGLPVKPNLGRVLYIAADRPRQIARSFRRMVSQDQRDELDERLIVRKGPLPFNLVREPWKLAAFVQSHECCEVVVDSLKDIAPGLASDEVGSVVNLALQECSASAIEVLVVHHHRKRTADNPRPKTLDDVYGSSMLTNGAGSVVTLWAPEAGSPIVEITHLKQPSHQVPDMTAVVDIERGDLVVEEAVDLLALVREATRGIAAAGAAAAMFATSDPNRQQVEKARRRLGLLVRKGLAHKTGGGRDEHGRQAEALYFATTFHEGSP
jgi:replicative DNA helicase